MGRDGLDRGAWAATPYQHQVAVGVGPPSAGSTAPDAMGPHVHELLQSSMLPLFLSYPTVMVWRWKWQAPGGSRLRLCDVGTMSVTRHGQLGWRVFVSPAPFFFFSFITGFLLARDMEGYSGDR